MSEVDEACEVDVTPVVAGGEATEPLEALKASIDAAVQLVDGRILRNGNLAIVVGGDEH